MNCPCSIWHSVSCILSSGCILSSSKSPCCLIVFIQVGLYPKRWAKLSDAKSYRTVDPVHHAEEHLAGLRIAAFDKGFDLVFEGTPARRVGLHQVSAVFVDHQQVVVFVEDVFG